MIRVDEWINDEIGVGVIIVVGSYLLNGIWVFLVIYFKIKIRF